MVERRAVLVFVVCVKSRSATSTIDLWFFAHYIFGTNPLGVNFMLVRLARARARSSRYQDFLKS